MNKITTPIMNTYSTYIYINNIAYVLLNFYSMTYNLFSPFLSDFGSAIPLFDKASNITLNGWMYMIYRH